MICGIDVSTHESNICRLSFRLATIASFIRQDRSKEVPKLITRTVHQRKAFNKGANNNCWPKAADLKKITQPIRLQAIKYKHLDNDDDLSAIQLLFTNKVKTPMFESESTKGAGLQTKTISIDPTKNIAAIGMKIEDDFVRGLRLMSDE